MIKPQNMAAMSIGGGRRENFYLAVLEYFPSEKRWFLSSINPVKDEEGHPDQVIGKWAHDFNIKHLVVDFPQNSPSCVDCKLVCPGTELCPNPEVTQIREKISALLAQDEEIFDHHPKSYERERISPEFKKKKSDEPVLSRSFKRKLKKGYIPYWHRPIDYWIWSQYYDQLLDIFKFSYDSFGHVSLMLMAKFQYLKKHFPSDLQFYESHPAICLLELHRHQILGVTDLQNLRDPTQSSLFRFQALKKIEKALNIFIYDKDLEILSRDSLAFDSFLLALTGRSFQLDQLRQVPQWALNTQSRFLAPAF